MLLANPFARRAVLFAAGAAIPLSLAPFFWWPVALLSLGIFIYCLRQSDSAKSAFGHAWWFGWGQFSTGISWIYVSMHDFGGTPVWLAVPAIGLFAGFMAFFPGLTFALWYRLVQQHLFWLTVPAFWFIQEWLRSWVLTGFPWLFIGDGHLHTWLAGWAPVFGSYGISLIVLLSVTVLFQAWPTKQPKWLAIWLLWPIGFGLNQIHWTEQQGQMTVGAVQGNISQLIKWKPEQIQPTIDLYFSETRAHWQADLMLWPETAITLLDHQFQPILEGFADEAIANNTTLMTGIPYQHSSASPMAGAFHNSIIAAGTGEGIYHKQRLVPFGEYVPLEDLIRGLIPFFDLEMSSFKPGSDEQPLLKATSIHPESGEEQLWLVAPYICYEIAYPELVRSMAQDADLLVTISNDAWFGDSLGPKQHMALAQMRALETGRYLLRSTNTGITALVDEKGQIVKRLPAAERGTLIAEAKLFRGQTPYMIVGLWPLLAFAFFVIIAVWLRNHRTHSSDSINNRLTADH